MSLEFSRASAADGQKFVFADEGSGPLVILLHGFPDTPYGWDRIAPALAAAGYRVVRPWLHGYHPETIIEGRGYDALAIAADPIALLDALGEKEAILVGHDWGAGITYGAAALAPERWRAIVPIAIPHPRLLPRSPQMLWKARHFFALKMPWAEAAARRGDFGYVDTLYKRWAPSWSGEGRDHSLAEVKRCFTDERSFSGALDYYRAWKPKLEPELAKPPAVRCLVVGGTDDIPPASTFEQTAEIMGPGSEALIVDGAGHWPHREDEDGFIAALIRFCGEI